MKIVWHDKKKDCIDLVAETAGEVALCDVLAVDVDGHRYQIIKKGKWIVSAKYSVIPEVVGSSVG